MTSFDPGPINDVALYIIAHNPLHFLLLFWSNTLPVCSDPSEDIRDIASKAKKRRIGSSKKCFNDNVTTLCVVCVVLGHISVSTGAMWIFRVVKQMLQLLQCKI